jgi:dipeptide transport system ATP-binding protein
MNEVLLAQGLTRQFQVRRSWLGKPRILNALNGVSLSLRAGKTLAVVGESGCGKSTLARILAMVDRPTSGNIEIAGELVGSASPGRLRALVQMVFQNPYASLNPRKTVSSILAEPLLINTDFGRAERQRLIAEMLAQVGLHPEHGSRYPHMFSGGQRQRIAIARAMILKPPVVIADEPTSALDVSIQAQILNLFAQLQACHGTSFLFVSHDLAAVRHVADEVMVMYLGMIVEKAPPSVLFSTPKHPYTQSLLSATPSLRQGIGRVPRIRLHGELPSPLDIPSGCLFHQRCPIADEACAKVRPVTSRLHEHEVACHKA